MNPAVKAAITRAVASEPFARQLDISLTALDDGHSRVEMIYDPARMDNIYSRAHGGALYLSLIHI